MNILRDTSLESNPYLKINFDGGDLSSDAGLLLIKEFAEKIGLVKIVYQLFKTNDTATFRLHIDPENFLQMVNQTIAAYFEDDFSDELTVDPIFTAILGKPALASQPTISRFFNRMDDTTLKQFDQIEKLMRDIVYSIKAPEYMLFDLDSTLLNTYGNQEGEAFNYHYQARGYHPLLCFDGITGDLLKLELRDGTHYCSNGADKFMEPLIREFRTKHPSLPLYLRGDSGFSFNWFRRLVLAANMRKLRINTVRLKLLKVAARAVRSARYTTFKLCSSCPYKKEFYEILQNIRGLQPQLE